MATIIKSTLSPKYDHETNPLLSGNVKQQHVVQVEKNPKDHFFLNVTLDIFYRLARLDVVNHRSNSPQLLLAAFYGWVDIIVKLLSLGSNPDVQDWKGTTALHVACTSVEVASTEIVQVLMNKGADPNLKVEATGFAPIHQLITACCNEAEPWDSNGKIEILVDAGADINIRDKHDRTPIHIASCIPWDNSVFDLLYQRGARLDLIDDMERSVLHYAAIYGDLDHIEYLREHRLTEPDPEGRDVNNQTPMDLMEWRANTEHDELWENMKQPTEEEVKAFRSLIKEIRIHRFQDGHGTSYQDHRGCWRQLKDPKTTNHLNPGRRLRPKPTLLPASSIEQGMYVGERCAYYA
ncbi:ankyrin repeat-containing domain protein [Fusarium sp. MPI-SDFR-AT-0072]|nr:ankyrin repeat-containing domain protein [Fusarium sp. MPI-SDFR-AT-0072]